MGPWDNPAWLATCRRRVAEVTGAALAGRAVNGTVSGLARVRALADITSPCHTGAQV